MFNADKTIIIAYVGVNETYNIPESVTSIGDWAFSGCELLTNINIPDSVIRVGFRAFSDCKNLNPKNKDDIIKRFGTIVF